VASLRQKLSLCGREEILVACHCSPKFFGWALCPTFRRVWFLWLFSLVAWHFQPMKSLAELSPPKWGLGLPCRKRARAWRGARDDMHAVGTKRLANEMRRLQNWTIRLGTNQHRKPHPVLFFLFRGGPQPFSTLWDWHRVTKISVHTGQKDL